jgi:hypothetical protein
MLFENAASENPRQKIFLHEEKALEMNKRKRTDS